MFGDDVARVAQDPEIRRIAERRAGSVGLAWDALQETWRTVAQTKNPESILDLRAFFCRSLINEITRQRARTAPVLVEDIGATAEQQQRDGPSSGGSPPETLENQVVVRMLGERMLRQLERDHDRLMASVPGRSRNQTRYRFAIIKAARKILRLLFEGPVTSADINSVLEAEYPQMFGAPGPQDATHQRYSRARRDVQAVLQQLVTREELIP
jgi:DNA-directed RNA polymerase specialized sigma24 family protein